MEVPSYQLNYYDILGLDPKITSDEDCKKKVQIAYIKMAKKCHPDKSKHEKSSDIFENITNAYEILIDDDKRREYDNKISTNYGSNDFFQLKNEFQECMKKYEKDAKDPIPLPIISDEIITPEERKISRELIDNKLNDMEKLREYQDKNLHQPKIENLNMAQFNKLFEIAHNRQDNAIVNSIMTLGNNINNIYSDYNEEYPIHQMNDISLEDIDKYDSNTDENKINNDDIKQMLLERKFQTEELNQLPTKMDYKQERYEIDEIDQHLGQMDLVWEKTSIDWKRDINE